MYVGNFLYTLCIQGGGAGALHLLKQIIGAAVLSSEGLLTPQVCASNRAVHNVIVKCDGQKGGNEEVAAEL